LIVTVGHLDLLVVISSVVGVNVDVVVSLVVVISLCLGACGVLLFEVFYKKVGIIRFEVMKNDRYEEFLVLLFIRLDLFVCVVTLSGLAFTVWHF